MQEQNRSIMRINCFMFFMLCETLSIQLQAKHRLHLLNNLISRGGKQLLMNNHIKKKSYMYHSMLHSLID